MEFSYSLDHIGIAVHSLEEGMDLYKNLGFEKLTVEDVPTEKVKVGFVPLKNGSNIELLEATSEDSPIAKFLSKRGPGIHHICLRVDDIRKVMAQLRAKGVRLINEEPKPGAHDCLVAFIHPSSAGGVLVELSQKMGGRKANG